MYRIYFRMFNVPPVAFLSCNPAFIVRRKCYKNLALHSNTSLFQTLQKIKFNTCVKLNAIFNQRYYSSDSDGGGKRNKPPTLMKFDPIYKPEIMLTIKNWILRKLIIQPYLDNDFSVKEFVRGSKKALEVVSSFLSQGDFQSLKGLVSDEAIREVKNSYTALTLKERQDLFVKATDVLFCFPHQIGIIFDDANQKRFAEINMIFHCFNDFEEVLRQGKVISEDAKFDIKICNYRFIREYTKGVQSDWIINRLGHFKYPHFET